MNNVKCPVCHKALASEMDLYGAYPGMCRECWREYQDFVAEQEAFLREMEDAVRCFLEETVPLGECEE